MSLCVGLGASQADLDVQGEIDFDFFEADNSTGNCIKAISKSHNIPSSIEAEMTCTTIPSASFATSLKSPCSSDFSVGDPRPAGNILESRSSPNFNKPLITISCDDATGVVTKTNIEAVIPSPFNYMDNKCGKTSPSLFKKGKKDLSPRLKNKVFAEEYEIHSDDSSISSMSDSESISSVSADSFELNEESDSMTDVSPFPSPLTCNTPSERLEVAIDHNDRLGIVSDQNPRLEMVSPDGAKENKKEGVKFNVEVDKKPCAKCSSIDYRELVNAINRIQINPVCVRKCASPVMLQAPKCRKNLSFSNEEVCRIDSNNQVLLKKIIAQQNRPKNHKASSVHVRSSSAINRQRQQRQIELENLALLKRLESTKPSRGLSRSQLLRDYDRRSPGILSRASSRSSFPGSSSQASLLTSGRSSAISIKSMKSVGQTSYST